MPRFFLKGICFLSSRKIQEAKENSRSHYGQQMEEARWRVLEDKISEVLKRTDMRPLKGLCILILGKWKVIGGFKQSDSTNIF